MAPRPNSEPIRVLVVEDSPAQRELLVSLLKRGGFAVVGTAGNGQQAVTAAERLRPDIVLMDIHLPGLNGYAATQQIMRRRPTPIVLISSISGDPAQRTVEALAAGALAAIRTPSGPHHPDHIRDRDALCTLVRLMAGVPVVTRFAPRGEHPAGRQDDLRHSGAAAQAQLPSIAAAPPRILAVAASTGGPQTLQRVLRDLGPDFPLPVVVVQHITAGFAAPLAEWLMRVIPAQVCIAQQHEALLPGRIYLAPDGAHLTVDALGRAALKPPKAGERFCPSADQLFASVATVYGASAIGVILTGMGDDGAQGLRALRMAGGYTLAQDAASCVVPGMPVAAQEQGAVERVVPLADLAAAVWERLTGVGA
jgi:two-component system chemotaxis response regulator CheB